MHAVSRRGVYWWSDRSLVHSNVASNLYKTNLAPLILNIHEIKKTLDPAAFFDRGRDGESLANRQPLPRGTAPLIHKGVWAEGNPASLSLATTRFEYSTLFNSATVPRPTNPRPRTDHRSTGPAGPIIIFVDVLRTRLPRDIK